MQKQLEAVVRKAGEIMLSANGSGEIFTKGGTANFATEYDLRIQEYLSEELARIIPQAAFVGEEGWDAERSDSLRWVVDPIDGTTNFMHGLKQSVISVALCEKSYPIAAMIYNPYTNELFRSEKDKGAFLNGIRIHSSERSPSEALIACGTTPYDRSLAGLSCGIMSDCFAFAADIRRSGTAAGDMSYVADGRYEGFFEYSLSPWDFSAGSLLITEAGGIATDFYGNALDTRVKSSVLCGNRETVDIMLGIIEKRLKSENVSDRFNR